MSKPTNKRKLPRAAKRGSGPKLSEAEFAQKMAEEEAIQVRDWCLQVLREAEGFEHVSSSFSAPNPEEPSTAFRMTFEVPMPTAHSEHIMEWLTEAHYDRRLDEHLERVEQQRSRRASKS
ncbi:MAG: hypothetical protein EOR86_17755 [Mesorhizobium sp.]|uniref:hypothetical protein n=1 Tax=Mesorhizobium sp. TaxID=1871066 RepID=UPI000FE73E32|nr:hypothetical protein [Mesorhizobium sp.]RWM94034.1 MAG: hypothetical protein EOR86_17755 [Mesorhizobium sp.]